MQPVSGQRGSYVQGALRLFEEWGDLEAVVGGDDRRLTYTQLRQAVLDLAAALNDHGVRPGSAVLVMMTNSIEGPILQLALHLLGCRSMWIASVTAPREITEFSKLAKPDVFVYDARTASEVGRQIGA
ncbi:MAG TPA: AMP-binding protein, partial [Jatrophihabitans sp.]|nr:AMP-binding protein [Jatrophihabitans sp.]